MVTLCSAPTDLSPKPVYCVPGKASDLDLACCLHAPCFAIKHSVLYTFAHGKGPGLELAHCLHGASCEAMNLVYMQVLAKKMTVLYKLSKEQLSSQHHYDFGLRALKSVLVMAGSLKRSSPDMSEALVLMRALRDMNLPKFVYDDVPLFLGLINDLFPGELCSKQPPCKYHDNSPLE